jgi:hypothetical protein
MRTVSPAVKIRPRRIVVDGQRVGHLIDTGRKVYLGAQRGVVVVQLRAVDRQLDAGSIIDLAVPHGIEGRVLHVVTERTQRRRRRGRVAHGARTWSDGEQSDAEHDGEAKHDGFLVLV